jgi:thiol-disulfide isomerase/thioredoxin
MMKTALLRTMLASLSVAQAFLPQRTLLVRFAGQRNAHNTRHMATNEEGRTSVTGTVYESDDANAPVITLFTKEGCTLCDKVKDVLYLLRTELPHTLTAVDITDDDKWFSKYKYDIPILHVGNQFWIKHRLNEEVARLGLQEAMEGSFVERDGDPDAGEMERRQVERLLQK